MLSRRASGNDGDEPERGGVMATTNTERAARTAVLAEVYLPRRNGHELGDATAAVARVSGEAAVADVRLVDGLYLPSDELLLLLFQPGDEGAVSGVLQSSGLAPLRISECRPVPVTTDASALGRCRTPGRSSPPG